MIRTYPRQEMVSDDHDSCAGRNRLSDQKKNGGNRGDGGKAKDVINLFGRRSKPVNVDRAVIAWMAQKAIRRAGYRGTSDWIFWATAALVHAGELSQAGFWSAVEGASLCSTRNPAGYFRTCLREHLRRRGADLEQSLKRIRLVGEVPHEE